MVDAVNTAGANVFRAAVPIQRSQSTVRVAPDTATDAAKAVVGGRPVGRVKEAVPGITPQIDPGVLGHEDAVLPVRVDGVVGHGDVRRALDVDAIPTVVADGVASDARRRRVGHCDAVDSVVSNRIRAGDDIIGRGSR